MAILSKEETRSQERHWQCKPDSFPEVFTVQKTMRRAYFASVSGMRVRTCPHKLIQQSSTAVFSVRIHDRHLKLTILTRVYSLLID